MRFIMGMAAILSILLPAVASADVISVAVASNFKDTLAELARDFESDSSHTIRLSAASTGKHYAQITHGAPFDVFLAADADRPALLEDEGLAVVGSRRAYALGALVLWAPAHEGDCRKALESGGFDRLAIANPRTAPYGRAAEELLLKLDIAETYKPRLVTGENISQAMHFVDASAAPAGLVAASHWIANPRREEGCAWQVPAEMHEPIEQQLVLLRRASDSVAAREFIDYLATERATKIISAHGYSTAE